MCKNVFQAYGQQMGKKTNPDKLEQWSLKYLCVCVLFLVVK